MEGQLPLVSNRLWQVMRLLNHALSDAKPGPTQPRSTVLPLLPEAEYHSAFPLDFFVQNA